MSGDTEVTRAVPESLSVSERIRGSLTGFFLLSTEKLQRDGVWNEDDAMAMKQRLETIGLDALDDEELALVCGEALSCTNAAGEHLMQVQAAIVDIIQTRDLVKAHPSHYDSLEDMLREKLRGNDPTMINNLSFFLNAVIILPEIATIIEMNGELPPASHLNIIMPQVRKAMQNDPPDVAAVARLVSEAYSAPDRETLRAAVSHSGKIIFYCRRSGLNWEVSATVDPGRLRQLSRLSWVELSGPGL